MRGWRDVHMSEARAEAHQDQPGRAPSAAHHLTLAFCCLCSGGALAQDKTDGLWRGTGAAALSLSSGNTSSSSLQVSADASKATAADKVTVGGLIHYAKNKTGGVDQTTMNKWSGFGQYDYNFSPRAFAFSKLGLDGDDLIELRQRASLAVGLGYKVIKSERMTWDVLGGVGYTADRYNLAQTSAGKTDTSFNRASIYVGEASSHQLSSTTALKQRLDVYAGISGDKAVLVKFSAGLSVAMNRMLSLTVGLTDTYNSKPALGTKSNDAGFFTGVNVKFGAP